MYKVILKACGNVDHRENPYSNVVNGTRVNDDVKEAETIDELRVAVRDYIERNHLGAGNWDGGQVFLKGKQVGYISYNGSYWEKGSKYYM